MSAKRPERLVSGTPLCRYAEWYETLSAELRGHLAPLLFGGRADGGGDSTSDLRASDLRPSELRLSDLRAGAGDPARDAQRAAELAARTDGVLADPAVRARWTGEGALAALDGDSHDAPRRTIRDRAVTRSVEWMRAVEQWALLRESGLAGRRIERWRAKHEGSEERPE